MDRHHPIEICGIDIPHIFVLKLKYIARDKSSFVIYILNSSKLWYTIVNSLQEHVSTKILKYSQSFF